MLIKNCYRNLVQFLKPFSKQFNKSWLINIRFKTKKTIYTLIESIPINLNIIAQKYSKKAKKKTEMEWGSANYAMVCSPSLFPSVPRRQRQLENQAYIPNPSGIHQTFNCQLSQQTSASTKTKNNTRTHRGFEHATIWRWLLG